MLISGLGDKVVDAFHKICLSIDGVIYNFINRLYTIFYVLSNNQFFSQEQFNDIASRLYVVIGIIMLFILSYSLLKAIANPDEFAKGENSFPNLIKNIVISIVIIALLPTVFRFAYSVQTTIVQNNVIGNIILPQDKRIDTDNVGIEMAMPIFQAFFHEADGAEVPEYETIIDEIETGSKKFSDIQLSSEIIDAISKDYIEYSFPFSTAAGLFVIWVLLLFCIDLGVRVIKLAFYQIIAPIPAICRVLPGSNIKKIWDNWVKVTLATYVEIFTRIAILFLGVYFIIMLKDFDFDIKTNGFLVKALIILGVIAFMRQAPKLLTDIFGFDSSKMGLGLKGLRERLSDGGGRIALTGGAAIGAGATTAAKNMVGRFANRDNWRDGDKITGKSVAKNLLGGIGGGLAGAVGGVAYGIRKGASAKNLKEMKKASSEASQKVQENAQKRAVFRAQHPGGIGARAVGRLSDASDKVKDYFGIDSLEGLNRKKEAADTMQGFYKTMASYVEDNERVASFKGAYEAEKAREIDDKVLDVSKYNRAVAAEFNALQKDKRYAGASNSQLRDIASSRVDKSQFERLKTDKEKQQAIIDKQQRLKMYDDLTKIAIIQAINEKLNDKDGDIIKDGRFQAVKNQVEVFKKQYADIDFAHEMHDIAGFNWNGPSSVVTYTDSSGVSKTISFDDAVQSGDPDAISALLGTFKDAKTSPAKFFSDSEQGKIKSGEAMAEIAKKIQEKKDKK